MAIISKKANLPIPSSLAAAAAAAGGTPNTTSGTKAVAIAPIDNTQLGLKDKSGKLLPNTITVQQAKDALAYTTNASTAENLKLEAAKQKYIPAGTALSPTGTITPEEINAVSNFFSQGFYNTPVGTPIKVLDIIKGLKDGSLNAAAQGLPTTTINRTVTDQPNVEASKATINDVFLTLLGRSATEKEIQGYTQKYLNYAAQNPTSRTTGETSYTTSQVPTSSGGVVNRVFRGGTSQQDVTNNLTEQAFLQNQVKQSGEYNAFTAAGSAFDMLTNMARKDTGAM
jgi:hypothetical protein